MKKKVLHILASNQYSGAQNVVCTIIDNFKNKYDMVYCCPRGPIEEILIEKKIKYILLNKLSISEIKKVVKKYNPDIIHAHDNRASILSSLFYRKCKIISHIHGNNKIMNTFNPKSFLYYSVSKKFSKIIWVSDSSLDGYYFKNSIIDRSEVIYNVIKQEEIIEKSELYECNEKYDLIFLGRLAYPKNPQRLIKIMRQIKENKSDIKLAIVGDGKDKNEIELLIKQYNLNNNIKLYGFQSNPYPILKNSKLLILTSIYEGTPMCVLEAQCLGKPIISTPVDGIKKIVINNQNGFLSENDNEIAEMILKILNDMELLREMSKNSIKAFNKNNNLKEYLEKLEKIYNEKNI